MEKSKIYDLLKKLTSNDLKFLLKKRGTKGYSGLKKRELIEKVFEAYQQDFEELHKDASEIYETKLIERVKDGLDHFLNKRVEILYADDELVKADVNGHTVVIYNLTKDSFEYRCDDSCQDYVYNVKNKRVPFCKHFIATVAELAYNGNVQLENIPILGESQREIIERSLEKRRKLEGISEKGREIEVTLSTAERYYLEIARQNEHIAKKFFKDSAEKVFEDMTLKLFDLLEFETIGNRSPHGWDGITIGIHATPPFIVVIECKTAQSGVYGYLVKHQDYLLTLKMYAVDLVKNKLFGAFRNYVKYVAVVAPAFPKGIESLKYSFQNLTGLQLSFIPADVLLYLASKYRENPIVTHSWLEDLFREGGLWTKEKIDKLFDKSEQMITLISEKVTEKVLEWLRQYVMVRSDAAFINFDMPMIEELSREIFQALSPELVVMGKKEVTGVETVRLRHDYYAIWEKVLKNMGRQFIGFLKELSDTQERTTEMKAEIIRQLRL